jgi:hypothetical protein
MMRQLNASLVCETRYSRFAHSQVNSDKFVLLVYWSDMRFSNRVKPGVRHAKRGFTGGI